MSLVDKASLIKDYPAWSDERPETGFRLILSNYLHGSFFMAATNAIMALIMVLAGIPLFLLIWVLLHYIEKGPIFYRGVRLGFNKIPFYIYKFRTLPVGTQKALGARVISRDLKLENRLGSPFSRLLRESRLDELPQLYNILRGEMDFIGPRPIRPEVFMEESGKIKDFNIRFTVRPGLVGIAQLFTPHSAPKRLRSRINNRFATTPRNRFREAGLIIYTVFAVLKTLVVKGTSYAYHALLVRLHNYLEKREQERITGEGIYVDMWCREESDEHYIGRTVLKDINQDFLCVHSSTPLCEESFVLKLDRRIKTRRKTKHKFARCSGSITRSYPVGDDRDGMLAYVIAYEPVSSYNSYMIDQYFLRKSLG